MRPFSNLVTVFLCGDVMTGRGIDQILPHPSDPVLYEPSLKNAKEYVELAEEITGPIPKPVDFAYIWGDALGEWERVAPDARIINLETAITRSHDWEDKDINYRMSPDNVACLTVAQSEGRQRMTLNEIIQDIHGLEGELTRLERRYGLLSVDFYHHKAGELEQSRDFIQ